MRLANVRGIALAGVAACGVGVGTGQQSSVMQASNSGSAGAVSSVFISPATALAAQRAGQQEAPNNERPTEVVANLATGRVYILITINGIIVGVEGTPAEAGSLPPQIVPLADRKLGVLLGAVDWKDVDSSQHLASFADELPKLRPLSGAAVPQLNRESTERVAADIEMTGLGVFEKLRGLAAMLHGRLALGPEQRALEILLADYVTDYGPEIWTLDYSFTQEEPRIGTDYWETHVTRPRYTQLWPPEKGQPHSLVTLGYPAAMGGAAAQAELLHAADAAESPPAVAGVKQAITAGDTRKLDVNDGITFMRAALAALPSSTEGAGNFAIAAIGEKTGFTWIVKQTSPAGTEKKRPSGAPTLIKP